ncbi:MULTISPECIES: phosphate signaling complex protein PhoU [Solibacillus]|uniref:phosphate signaling complex protein PhoU n=1 Tax=Solibacillus TaxID=648800 RepID=UPI00203A554D|nr:phosphate signaling complex protein PhoU [Solibacillus isronensis]MCM3720809.1 phosphate signaling complex protein PhoU [Solibacillus isronensis]
MMIRERFEQDLIAVQQDLMELCDLSIHALQESFKAFLKKDIDLALQVIDTDPKINRLEELINDRVILLIAKQQPVATDLRRLIVVIKAASDMERIGDHAVNIAKESIRIGNAPFVTSVEPIEEMFHKTILMLRQIVDAFIEENTIKAKEIANLDDEVDELTGNTLSNLMKLSVSNEHVAQVTSLSYVCRCIERAADHATNIAEHLFYLVKGKHYELNN